MVAVYLQDAMPSLNINFAEYMLGMLKEFQNTIFIGMSGYIFNTSTSNANDSSMS